MFPPVGQWSRRQPRRCFCALSSTVFTTIVSTSSAVGTHSCSSSSCAAATPLPAGPLLKSIVSSSSYFGVQGVKLNEVKLSSFSESESGEILNLESSTTISQSWDTST